MKFSALVFVPLSAAVMLAQQTTPPSADIGGPGTFSPITLGSDILEHDFFNFFAYGDGVYDSYAPIFNAQNQLISNGSYGLEVGGGVNGTHAFRNAELSLSYRGDYREYQNPNVGAGTDQSLGLSYTKRLNRRWSFYFQQSAGIVYYGGTFFNPNESALAPISPFSPETKFLSSSIGFTYLQTRRLSYSVTGSFFLQRYNYLGAIGSTGGSGSLSVNYRTTARTTIGASYSHMLFDYQRGAGEAQADSIAATLSHQFHNHWLVSLSGGATRSQVNGTVTIPVTLLVGNQAIGGYEIGHYNQASTFPSFSGTVSHQYRHTTIAGTAGQGISAGNGYFLASKDQFVSGVLSHSLRRSTASVAGSWFRLSSIANSVATQYSSASLSASYSVNLIRYFNANATYSYIYYGNLPPIAGIKDNRITFGFSFSSKSIPLTLY